MDARPMDNIVEMLKKALISVGLRKRKRPKALSIDKGRRRPI
jgi:hypothetical protein